MLIRLAIIANRMLIYGSFFFWTCEMCEKKKTAVCVNMCGISSIYYPSLASLYYYCCNEIMKLGFGDKVVFGFWFWKKPELFWIWCRLRCRHLIGSSVAMLLSVVTNSHTMMMISFAFWVFFLQQLYSQIHTF